MKSFDIVCYHKNCPDGIGGLWVANHYQEIPIHYPLPAGENPEIDQLEEKRILFVDVCPQVHFILSTIHTVKKITILDHHKTSKEMVDTIVQENIPNLEVVFDMERSGARIAWDYFFPANPCPFFIQYIEDKDLWKWKLEFSQEINFALQDHLNLKEFTCFFQQEKSSFQTLLKEGKALKEKNDEKIRLISSQAIKGSFHCDEQTYHVMIVENADRSLTSDVGNYLCESYPEIDFAVITFQKPDYYSVSLRGIKGKCPDLSKIAKHYGGGGHESSSGMRVTNLDKIIGDPFL